MTGRVTKIFDERGFGFVQGNDGVGYFVHRRTVGDDVFDLLDEGDFVEFESIASPRGPRVATLRRL